MNDGEHEESQCESEGGFQAENCRVRTRNKQGKSKDR